MKNAIYLFLKYGVHAVFVILLIISFSIIINYNESQKSIFDNTSLVFAQRVNNGMDRLNNFVKLEIINDSLQKENAKLIENYIRSNNLNFSNQPDTVNLDTIQYEIIPVKICNTSFRKKNNYLTLCQGSKDGLKVNMGVISKKGLVGQIVNVSDHFAVVMSILHTQSKVSASIKNSQAYGTLRWDGNNPQYLNLEAIPKHIEVAVGDTIITSGYSTIYPRGIEVGIISEANVRNNDYEIKLKLFNNPAAWEAVYVVMNKLAEEQLLLEEATDL